MVHEQLIASWLLRLEIMHILVTWGQEDTSQFHNGLPGAGGALGLAAWSDRGMWRALNKISASRKQKWTVFFWKRANMLKDRFFEGTIPLPNVGKVFYFVSEMPTILLHQILRAIQHFTSRLPFSVLLNGLRQVTWRIISSVFNFDSNERVLVCTLNKKLCSSWLQQEPVPWIFFVWLLKYLQTLTEKYKQNHRPGFGGNLACWSPLQVAVQWGTPAELSGPVENK